MLKSQLENAQPAAGPVPDPNLPAVCPAGTFATTRTAVPDVML
ncbi:MAG TPA: hypothetical protein VL371_10140 [Gemmataceae bacterium]|nr:hypothetical protein [Gemmataceae bacterium]